MELVAELLLLQFGNAQVCEWIEMSSTGDTLKTVSSHWPRDLGAEPLGGCQHGDASCFGPGVNLLSK